MSEEAIRLSVIIPVYNAEDTVRGTLDSVLGQSLKEIEVICVDDGSTDRSADVVREYAARDRRVSLIRQQNRYAGTARNAGIDAAKGTYLFFLDADDSVLDYALEAVCVKAEKHGLDCLRFQSLVLDEKGKRYIKDPWTGGGLLRPGDYDRLLKMRKDSPLLRVSVAPWSGICRRAFVVEKNCRFNSLRCVNDRSFYNKTMTCADRIMITRDRVTVHRVNRDQSLIGTKAAHFDCQIASLKLTERQLTEDGVLPETAEAVMRQEYLDLAVWYRRFAGTPARRAEMDRQIGAYLDGGETAYGGLLREQLEKLPAPAAPPEEIHPFHEPSRDPAVTVLVPVRNGAEAPDRALRSLTDQTLEEAEFLLLYADGKNDLSLKIIREYSALDRRFIPVDCSGAEGYGQMMNRGLEQARGKYVGILDPEDCADRELCRRLREKAEKRGPDLIRCAAVRFRIGPDGTQRIRSVGAAEGKAFCRRAFLEESGIRWDEGAGRDGKGFPDRALSAARRVCLLKEPLVMEQAGEGEELFPEGEAEARAGALERLGRKIRTGSRMIREKGVGSAAGYLREKLGGTERK